MDPNPTHTFAKGYLPPAAPNTGNANAQFAGSTKEHIPLNSMTEGVWPTSAMNGYYNPNVGMHNPYYQQQNVPPPNYHHQPRPPATAMAGNIPSSANSQFIPLDAQYAMSPPFTPFPPPSPPATIAYHHNNQSQPTRGAGTFTSTGGMSPTGMMMQDLYNHHQLDALQQNLLKQYQMQMQSRQQPQMSQQFQQQQSQQLQQSYSRPQTVHGNSTHSPPNPQGISPSNASNINASIAHLQNLVSQLHQRILRERAAASSISNAHSPTPSGRSKSRTRTSRKHSESRHHRHRTPSPNPKLARPASGRSLYVYDAAAPPPSDAIKQTSTSRGNTDTENPRHTQNGAVNVDANELIPVSTSSMQASNDQEQKGQQTAKLPVVFDMSKSTARLAQSRKSVTASLRHQTSSKHLQKLHSGVKGKYFSKVPGKTKGSKGQQRIVMNNFSPRSTSPKKSMSPLPNPDKVKSAGPISDNNNKEEQFKRPDGPVEINASETVSNKKFPEPDNVPPASPTDPADKMEALTISTVDSRQASKPETRAGSPSPKPSSNILPGRSQRKRDSTHIPTFSTTNRPRRYPDPAVIAEQANWKQASLLRRDIFLKQELERQRNAMMVQQELQHQKYAAMLKKELEDQRQVLLFQQELHNREQLRFIQREIGSVKRTQSSKNSIPHSHGRYGSKPLVMNSRIPSLVVPPEPSLSAMQKSLGLKLPKDYQIFTCQVDGRRPPVPSTKLSGRGNNKSPNNTTNNEYFFLTPEDTPTPLALTRPQQIEQAYGPKFVTQLRGRRKLSNGFVTPPMGKIISRKVRHKGQSSPRINNVKPKEMMKPISPPEPCEVQEAVNSRIAFMRPIVIDRKSALGGSFPANYDSNTYVVQTSTTTKYLSNAEKNVRFPNNVKDSGRDMEINNNNSNFKVEDLEHL